MRLASLNDPSVKPFIPISARLSISCKKSGYLCTGRKIELWAPSDSLMHRLVSSNRHNLALEQPQKTAVGIAKVHRGILP